ncbi:MAG: succinyl-diaminopimelate desuccinylase [Gammaproteobacteria bacterium RIFCSPHIGHO2_12_FULL_38_14]|nr:MAG: succinyl-diaminopimelate desuccinylase [Gammaproteobacteria bacterium RIFCSPHIGHO2_12_FULL_38_14]
MDDVISLAKQLIACPSVTPQDAGAQFILMERLRALGFQCETMRFDDVDNLWARLGTASPLVVFAGHTDVVPTGPETDWTSPPFQPEIRDDYLYGRGASDMKGCIAAMIIAVEKFVKENPKFTGSIAFLITSDEEGLAINGTKKVIDTLEARNEKIDFCIVGEPSSESMTGDQVRVGRRGSLHGSLIVHGKQGHVAHPHLAKNPIHLSLPALYQLTQTEWDKGNEDFPSTTFQITNIHAGTGATNVIPGHLEVVFNFRFSTAVTVKELQDRTQTVLHQHGLTYDLKWRVGGEPFLTDKGVLITATQLAIKEITTLEPRLSTGGGTSDGRFIAPTGAKVIELGVSHATAHQVDECVRIDDLKILVRIYDRLLKILFHV